MKKTIKKLSTVLLALAMIANLSLSTGMKLYAEETEADQPAATESEETSAPKATKKPAEETSKPTEQKPEKTEESETESPKSSEKTEAETSKETEAAKETEEPAAKTPDETDKPAAETPDETDKPSADTPDETEIPDEPDESDADIPDETEESADKAPVESDKPEANEPETDKDSKKVPDESDSKESKNDFTYAEFSNIKIENGILSWDAMPGTEGYYLWIYSGENGCYWWDCEDPSVTSINLKKLIDIGIKSNNLSKQKNNTYTFELYAFGVSAHHEGSITYKSSAKPYKIGKISGVKYSGGKLSWKKYSGASKYTIAIEDFKGELRFSSNSYNFNNLIDKLIKDRTIYKRNSYRVYIYAYDKDDVYMAYWNGTIKYQSKATPCELPAINASINGDILSWDAYTGGGTVNYYNLRVVCPDQSWAYAGWGDGFNSSQRTCDLKEVIASLIDYGYIKEYSTYTLELTAINYDLDLPLAEWAGTYKYKEPNTLKASSKKASVKYNKKKNKTIKRTSVIKITDAGQGAITYKKVSGNSKITINANSGNITVKKKLKKKTYTIKVKVIAAGDDTTARLEKILTIKIKLK